MATQDLGDGIGCSSWLDDDQVKALQRMGYIVGPLKNPGECEDETQGNSSAMGDRMMSDRPNATPSPRKQTKTKAAKRRERQLHADFMSNSSERTGRLGNDDNVQKLRSRVEWLERQNESLERKVQDCSAYIRKGLTRRLRDKDAIVQTSDARVETSEASVQTSEARVEMSEGSVQMGDERVEMCETSTQTSDGTLRESVKHAGVQTSYPGADSRHNCTYRQSASQTTERVITTTARQTVDSCSQTYYPQDGPAQAAKRGERWIRLLCYVCKRVGHMSCGCPYFGWRGCAICGNWRHRTESCPEETVGGKIPEVYRAGKLTRNDIQTAGCKPPSSADVPARETCSSTQQLNDQQTSCADLHSANTQTTSTPGLTHTIADRQLASDVCSQSANDSDVSEQRSDLMPSASRAESVHRQPASAASMQASGNIQVASTGMGTSSQSDTLHDSPAHIGRHGYATMPMYTSVDQPVRREQHAPSQDAPSTCSGKEMVNEQVVTRDCRGSGCREGESQLYESREIKATGRLGTWVLIMNMFTVLDKLLSGQVGFDDVPVTIESDADVFDKVLISRE